MTYRLHLVDRLRSLGILACLVCLAAALGRAAPAQAHAHYAHSQPAIGQVLQAAPDRVDIYTDSDMRKLAGANVITVTGPDGSRADDGNTVVDDANRQHFSVGLQPNLANGRYVVSFQTLSDVDGDTDHGKFAFYVGTGPTAQQQQLDAQLNGVVPTSATGSAQSAGSSAPWTIILPIVIAVAVIIALLAGLGAIFRRRRHDGDA